MDPAALNTLLFEAERRLAEGKTRLDRQRKLVEELKPDRHGLRAAQRLLTTLEMTQQLNLQTRDRIRKDLARVAAKG